VTVHIGGVGRISDVRDACATVGTFDDSPEPVAREYDVLIMTSVAFYRIDCPTAGGRTGNTLHESSSGVFE